LIMLWLAGMFEAGTFPAMWAHLTRFYAGGPHLAAAWGFIGAAQPFAQVPFSYLACSFGIASMKGEPPLHTRKGHAALCTPAHLLPSHIAKVSLQS